MNVEERALIARASRGDVEAFSKLVRAHSALVRGVTFRILGGQEAQDASQEVWVRVWANMKSFRGDSAFSTWLYRVALGNVRAEHRAAMVMRHMEDLSCAEISEVLGVPDGTVKGWASRGRTAMLAALTQGSASADRTIRPHQAGRKTVPQSAADDAGAPGPGHLC
jgi:RNA polymerase sigma-70 factor (ECF subfamily)